MINTDTHTVQKTDYWLTLQEASNVTGKSVNALTLLINRRKIDRTKKVSGRGKGKWLIHRDSVEKINKVNLSDDSSERLTELNPVKDQTEYDRLINSIPLEHYEKKREEWDRERDRLVQGLVMYQWKFEELDKKIRLLPAPVESVLDIIKQREEKINEQVVRLQEKDFLIKELNNLLEQEKKQSWWKKFLGVR